MNQPDYSNYLKIEATTNGTFKLLSCITGVEVSNVYSSENSWELIGEYNSREVAQIMLDLELIKIRVHVLETKLK